MSPYKRFFIGGVGGLAPVLMFLVTVDWENYVSDMPTLKVVGYCVRTLILFFIGGFVGYRHKGERQPFKVFQLGLGAPALIAGYLTVSLVPAAHSAQSPTASSALGFSLVTVAFAQSDQPVQTLRRFTLPPESPAAQFLEGLVGIRPKTVWFVIVGSYLRLEEAEVHARQINQNYREFKAEAYDRYGDNPYYAVVIGAHLTQTQAKALRDKAVRGGLGKNVYYKTFPNLPPVAE